MKKCYKCENWLSVENFTKDKTRKDGLHPYCKICRSREHKKYINKNPNAKENRRIRSKMWKKNNPERYKELIKKWKKENYEQKALLDRKSQLWTHYRLTIEDYLEMVDKQNGQCAICKKNKKLYIDHNHSCCPSNLTCGRCVRGLVCQRCNMFLSYLDCEYIDYIEIAKEYINRNATII